MAECSTCAKTTDTPQEDGWCSWGDITLPVGDGEYEEVEYEEGEDYPCDAEDCRLDDLCPTCEIKESGAYSWTGEEKTVTIYECNDCCPHCQED